MPQQDASSVVTHMLYGGAHPGERGAGEAQGAGDCPTTCWQFSKAGDGAGEEGSPPEKRGDGQSGKRFLWAGVEGPETGATRN
jgi:hypothetical protein